MSVVVVARNAEATIGCQLRALDDQVCEEPWEIVVADNGSSDATRAVAAAEGSSRTRVVDCHAARGIAAARNAAIAAARGDVIVFADADDRATPGWLTGMRDALRTHDLVGCVLDDGPLNATAARRWRPPMPRCLPTSFGYLPYAPTASLGFHRRVSDAIGGFDERFDLAAEDVDFCWRAQLAGFRLGFADDAVMEYRLRDRPAAVVRQSYTYGVAGVMLPVAHPDRPLAIGRWRRLASELAALARDLPILMTADWPRLAARAAWVAGRLAGSARHRRLCI